MKIHKERPILFSGSMVRAIREGRKTQTRRVISNVDVANCCTHQCQGKSEAVLSKCPYGKPGDRLWVRETTCIAPKRFAAPDDTCLTDYDGDKRYVSYKADGHSEDAMRDYKLNWTPSIHMPRWVSRITLEIVYVRVERLQDISEADAKREGLPNFDADGNLIHKGWLFEDLWNRIHGPGSWDLNPWVWVVEFKEVKP